MLRLIALCCLAPLFTPQPAHAQTIALGPVRPRANLIIGAAGLTVTPAAVTFALVQGGTAVANKPIAITTTVIGIGFQSTLQITAYFATTTALTDGSGNNIPSSAVFGICPTCIPTTYTPFTGTTTYAAGSSLNLVQSLSALTVLGGVRTDNLTLQIDLSTLPQTPAGTYSGTLVLAAQVF